jgi:hypothetical protein
LFRAFSVYIFYLQLFEWIVQINLIRAEDGRSVDTLKNDCYGEFVSKEHKKFIANENRLKNAFLIFGIITVIFNSLEMALDYDITSRNKITLNTIIFIVNACLSTWIFFRLITLMYRKHFFEYKENRVSMFSQYTVIILMHIKSWILHNATQNIFYEHNCHVD